jgi:hypothetical protein
MFESGAPDCRKLREEAKDRVDMLTRIEASYNGERIRRTFADVKQDGNTLTLKVHALHSRDGYVAWRVERLNEEIRGVLLQPCIFMFLVFFSVVQGAT